MSEKELFSSVELEAIGIHLETTEKIVPYLIPLDHMETAVYGQPEIPLSARVILPDIEALWKTDLQLELHEEVAILEDDVLEDAEDSVEESEDTSEEGTPTTAIPPKLPKTPTLDDKTRKAPPPVPNVSEEPARKVPPPVPPKIDSRTPEANWSDTFFDDDYVSTLDPPHPKKTQYEVEFLYTQLELAPGMKVLDVGCADGRHAIGLVARGVQALGIDISVAFLLTANQAAQETGQPATFIKKDMREYVPASLLNAVICFGGSFGYFSDTENADLLHRFASWLVPGGKLLLEVMHRDYVVSQLPSRIWWEGNGCMVMDECYFQYADNRLLVKRNAAFVSGKQRNYELTIRAYTLREISDLVEAAGFRILSISGSVYTPNAFTGQLSPSIILVLQK